jgi:hypothetical protein
MMCFSVVWTWVFSFDWIDELMDGALAFQRAWSDMDMDMDRWHY